MRCIEAPSILYTMVGITHLTFTLLYYHAAGGERRRGPGRGVQWGVCAAGAVRGPAGLLCQRRHLSCSLGSLPTQCP
jgi:hypothetical protein